MTTSAQDDINNALEEEKKDEQKSLAGIVAKIKAIGNEQYDGKMFDNIYSIFNQLLVSERRMLLKGIINILLIVEDKSANGTLVNQGYVQTPGLGAVQNTVLQVEEHITGNLNNIEQFNKMEMIKLKSRITMIAVVTVLFTLAGMMLIAVYMSNSKTETIGVFAEFWKIIAEMMGI